MAYVDVPKDLTNIKTKFIGHFTKRQCICFGLGIVVGFPGYFIARAAIGTTAAFYVLIAIMAPFFLFGILFITLIIPSTISSIYVKSRSHFP